MTPEEARRLLDGTTPGPWYLSSSRSVDGIDIVMYDDTVMERRNIALAAAAPTLAAMIAGMREEWGVSCGGEKPGAWWASHKEADQCAKRMRICIHYPLPIVVVRRYVTEPEEA